MSPGQGSPFGSGSLLALAAMVAAGFTNLFKQLRRCQRFAYFPKHREMVLFGSASVALFSNSGPRETTKCHSWIDLRFPLNAGMLRY
jgi:hypothetical protein